MRILVLGVLAACALVGRPLHCVAAESRPVLVCSFSSCDEIAADLDYLGGTAKIPSLPQAVGTALSRATGVQGLEGLDRRRPWGAVLSTDGLKLTPVAFMPVHDADALLRSLAPWIGEAQPQPQRQRLWKIGEGAATGFVLEQNGWAYLAQTDDVLLSLPDPLATLGALPSKYDVAVQLYPTRLPEALRTMGIDMIREQMLTPPPRDSPNESSAALRHLISSETYRAAERLLSEQQQVTIGWSLDRTARLARLEVTTVPEPGSRAARDLAGWKPGDAIKSPVDAGLTGHASLVLSKTQIEPFRNTLNTCQNLVQHLVGAAASLSSSERESAAGTIATLTRFMEPALERGLVDVSLTAYGQTPPFAVVATARVGDAATVRAALGKLVEQGANGQSSMRVTLDAARLGNLRVHSVEFPRLSEAAEFNRLLGRDATLFIAESEETVLLAIGNRALSAIETSLATPVSKQPPLSLTLRLGTAAAAVAAWTEDQPAAPLVALLGASLRVADDRLIVAADNDGRSLRVSVEVREGVLQAAALGLNLWTMQRGAER